MTRRTFLLAAPLARAVSTPAGILDPEQFRHHVEFFNRMVPEDPVTTIPNAEAWAWMKSNIPFFTCPDADVERTYYYRWWTYRKAIKRTPSGFIITEFLKPVQHAGEYNALSCAFGHHVAEGRWLKTTSYLDEYARFWLCGGDNGGIRKNFHQFSGWAAAALYDRWLADGRMQALTSMLDSLLLDYRAWERERMADSGLFWQRDVSDGMEESISGGRHVRNLRPSINSYMYGNARAIASIAGLAGRRDAASEYRDKAVRLRRQIQTRLWNPQDRFFETVLESGTFAGVREEIGFTPWCFHVPEADRGFEIAWQQLMDPQGFYAPFGPTTAEQRNPGFKIAYEGDDCQWNGPSWPFATTITLRALANVLNGYHQNVITRQDYFETFEIYTRSHRLKLPGGRVIPWIDENLNPRTGEWLARAMKIRKGTFYGRGDHYNHSCYCDLVITGVAGLRPRPDEVIEVNPLVPAGKWEWFCLDGAPYHGRRLSIVWDPTGRRFGRGRGLAVFADGVEIARAPDLRRVTGKLPPA